MKEEKYLAAARRGDSVAVSQCLEANIPVDHKDEQGRTALFHAAECGHLAMVNFLLTKGANVNHKMRDGSTILTRVVDSEMQRSHPTLAIIRGINTEIRDYSLRLSIVNSLVQYNVHLDTSLLGWATKVRDLRLIALFWTDRHFKIRKLWAAHPKFFIDSFLGELLDHANNVKYNRQCRHLVPGLLESLQGRLGIYAEPNAIKSTETWKSKVSSVMKAMLDANFPGELQELIKDYLIALYVENKMRKYGISKESTQKLLAFFPTHRGKQPWREFLQDPSAELTVSLQQQTSCGPK